jgi:hypothetical protein
LVQKHSAPRFRSADFDEDMAILSERGIQESRGEGCLGPVLESFSGAMTHGALEDCADQDRDQSAKPILGQTSKGHLGHTQEVHFGEEVSGSDSMVQQPSVSSRGLAAIETRILLDAIMSPLMHGSYQVSALQATQDLIRSGT